MLKIKLTIVLIFILIKYDGYSQCNEHNWKCRKCNSTTTSTGRPQSGSCPYGGSNDWDDQGLTGPCQAYYAQQQAQKEAYEREVYNRIKSKFPNCEVDGNTVTTKQGDEIYVDDYGNITGRKSHTQILAEKQKEEREERQRAREREIEEAKEKELARQEKLRLEREEKQREVLEKLNKAYSILYKAKSSSDYKEFVEFCKIYNVNVPTKELYEVKEKANNLNWLEVRYSWNSKQYKEHLSSFYSQNPKSVYIDSARNRYNECIVWEVAEKANSINAINEYEKKYPNGHFIDLVKELYEKTYFNLALNEDKNGCEPTTIKNEGAIQKWNEYLSKYPNGIYSNYASIRLLILNDNLDLETANISELKKQLEKYDNFQEKNIFKIEFPAPCLPSFSQRQNDLKFKLKLKIAKRTPSLLLNLIIPGIGNRSANKALNAIKESGKFSNKLEEKYNGGFIYNASFLTTLFVGTSLGYSFIERKKASDSYENYLNSFDPVQSEEFLKSAQNHADISNGLMITGILFWSLDCVNVIWKKNLLNQYLKYNSNSKYSYDISPSKNHLGLSLTINIK
jgi:hypothetical protein